MCKSVSCYLLLNLTLTSKKFISFFEYSTVNLVVGWKVLSVLINCFKACLQIKNVSSIYLHHMCGYISMFSKIFSSRVAIKRIAYGGPNLVPIAVPCKCLKLFHWTGRCYSLKEFLQVLLKFQSSLFSPFLPLRMWDTRIKNNNINSTKNSSFWKLTPALNFL